MIVKIQVSLFPEERSLTTTQDKRIQYECALEPAIRKIMAGRLKAYFHAHQRKDGVLVIDDAADEQDW